MRWSENTFKRHVRAADGKESLLAEPDDWQKETGKPHAINDFEASPDGSLVAVGISPGGNELASIHLIETATKKRIGRGRTEEGLMRRHHLEGQGGSLQVPG
ncbi:MAG: hypothetical protein ABIO71_07445 [Caldimonas sp.]